MDSETQSRSESSGSPFEEIEPSTQILSLKVDDIVKGNGEPTETKSSSNDPLLGMM